MTGDIHAAKSLDRETKSQYVLHASAVDWRTNQTLEAESEFIIKVQDVNDNAPSFREEPFTATVPEMSDIGKPSILGHLCWVIYTELSMLGYLC